MNDDSRTIATLRAGVADEVRGHHLGPVPTAPSARRSPAPYLAVAACLAGAGVVAAVHAAAGSHSGRHTTAAGGGGCANAVVTSALPTWARSGFSPDAYVNAHVTGAHQRIVAVLFADPLHAPPTPGENNKILWVARDEGTGPLQIRAQLDGGTPVTRTVAGGPGPSTVDLPSPGCWHLTLTWSGQHDTMSVPYVP